MLEGLLVDLVPHGKEFDAREHALFNSEAWFWAVSGDRWFRTQNQVKARQDRHREDGPSPEVMFGVRTKAGMPIGHIALNWVVSHQRLAMLGAVISDPAYWGGGYGTDALLLAVDYAFDWLDLRKLWLSTTSANARVQRQMEKVGFQLEARRRDGSTMDGVWVDELFFAMKSDDWPGRAALIERLGLRARPGPGVQEGR